MIRAIRPNAMAQDDAAMVSGWNIAPNLAYTVVLLPGSSSCGALLYDEDGPTLVATGAALVGTAQPCVLIPQTGQTVGMVDADLGWHLLLTTAGTESQRTIRIGPAVDLPDEIHPVYGEDTLALARAKAAIDAAAHYIDDVTVTCPLGLGAGLGDVVSVPVDGVVVVGQVESITWTATPDGTTETAVIRRHMAIAPEQVVEITPPTVSDDTGAATHLAGTSGNVLANDEAGLTITAVNGLSANVGASVDGDNGGTFTVNADGSWIFTPDGDFALLEGSETAETSVNYHASDGTAEAMATLTVTVSYANTAPVAVGDTGETTADATTSGNVLVNDTDADSDALTVSQVAGSAANVGVAVAGSNGGLFTIGGDGAWVFDPDGDFAALEGEATATTNVTYHVSDGVAEDEGTLTVTVIAASAAPWTLAEVTSAQWLDYADTSTLTWASSKVSTIADKSGNDRHATQPSDSNRPSDSGGLLYFADNCYMTHNVPQALPCHIFWVIDITQLQSGGPYSILNRYAVSPPYPPGVYISGQAELKPELFWGNGWAGQYPTQVIKALMLLELIMTPTQVGFRVNGGTAQLLTHSNSAISYWNSFPSDYLPQAARHGMAERLIVNTAVDDALRYKIEGRLTHKWDALLSVSTLVGQLPSDHPYKSAPPML